MLDGSADHLNDIYDDAAKNEGHEPWKDSPGEIALHDYRDFLGRKDYQRAWVDFFEDQLVQHGYDWQSVVRQFVFESGDSTSPHPLPMFNCLVTGLGHPIIHLGYAYELNSREIAMEALGLVATCYDDQLASLLESAASTTSTADPPEYNTSDPLEVLERLNGDKRLDGHFSVPGSNLAKILETPALLSIVLSHWNSWKITDPILQFEQSQRLAAALLIASSPHVGGHGYDFFLVHLLTISHAVRILIPYFDTAYHLPLVRQWFLITCLIYVAQLRPLVETSYVDDFDLKGQGWEFVDKEAIGGKWSLDAHFVKALRSFKEAEKLWGGTDQYFLRAAVRLAREFDGWGGFGSEDQNDEAEHGGGLIKQ